MASVETIPAAYTVRLTQDEFDRFRDGLIDLFRKSEYQQSRLHEIAFEAFGVDSYDYTVD